MPPVETVRGPIDTADLGATLMREHVLVLSTEHVQNDGADWWNEDERVAEQTDVQIIVATGLCTYDEIPHQYERATCAAARRPTGRPGRRSSRRTGTSRTSAPTCCRCCDRDGRP